MKKLKGGRTMRSKIFEQDVERLREYLTSKGLTILINRPSRRLHISITLPSPRRNYNFTAQSYREVRELLELVATLV
jgi:hypothetical protein